MYETTPEDYAKLGAAKEVLRQEANAKWRRAAVCSVIPGINVLAWADAHVTEKKLRTNGCIDPDEWYFDANGNIQRR